MASPSNCDICGEVEAVMGVSNFDSGETRFTCLGCCCRFMLALALEVLPPEEILAAVGPIHVAGAEPKPKGGRKSTRATEPEAEAEPVADIEPDAEGLAEAPAAADHG